MFENIDNKKTAGLDIKYKRDMMTTKVKANMVEFFMIASCDGSVNKFLL